MKTNWFKKTMIKVLKLSIFMTVLISMLIMVSCNKADKEIAISKDSFMLDTLINITLYGSDDDKLIDEAFNRVSELENMLSVHKENSDLYNIKIDAGKKSTSVSETTMNIIEDSMLFYEKTNKAYDITLGPLIELWNNCRDTQTLPEEEVINSYLPLVGSDNILLDNVNNTVTLKEGMFIDLGASAKGYIADDLKSFLIDNGIENAIINLGGNINIIGSNTNGQDFNIGIRNPNKDAGSYLGILSVSDTSVVTSGDYERYFEKDGKRYHHIISPFTGYPVDNELRAVTIVCENSLHADILSTSVFLLGLQEGKELIDDLDGVEAIFITKDNDVYLTDGLKDKFKLVDEEFKLQY